MKKIILGGVVLLFLILNFVFIPDYYQVATKIDVQVIGVDTLHIMKNRLMNPRELIHHMDSIDVYCIQYVGRQAKWVAQNRYTGKLLWERLVEGQLEKVPSKDYLLEIKRSLRDLEPIELVEIDLNTGKDKWRKTLPSVLNRRRVIYGKQTIMVLYSSEQGYNNGRSHYHNITCQILELDTGESIFVEEDTLSPVSNLFVHEIELKELMKQKRRWISIDYYQGIGVFFDKERNQLFNVIKENKQLYNIHKDTSFLVLVGKDSIYAYHIPNQISSKARSQPVYPRKKNGGTKNYGLALGNYVVEEDNWGYKFYDFSNLERLKFYEKKDMNITEEQSDWTWTGKWMFENEGNPEWIFEVESDFIYFNKFGVGKKRILKRNYYSYKCHMMKGDHIAYLYEHDYRDEFTYVLYKYKIPLNYQYRSQE